MNLETKRVSELHKYYFCQLKNLFMKNLYIFVSIALILSMLGCGSGKQLAHKNESAEAYYMSKNYNDALFAYSEIIKIYESNNNSAACHVYTKAGESALKTDDYKLAIDYLKKASNSNFVDESTYLYLSQAYAKVDNLSLEMMTLVDYVEKYPNGKHIDVVKTRLFYTYVESDNYENALELWSDVYSDNQPDIQLLEAYFKVNKSIGNTDTCNEIAQHLISIDADNIVALTWFGKQYYYKAEDRYRAEMTAYDNHKTNKQYKILLKALDVVTADFKKSLSYFKKMYALEPTSENANFLAHIYGRLSDKKKEAYYKGLAK